MLPRSRDCRFSEAVERLSIDGDGSLSCSLRLSYAFEIGCSSTGMPRRRPSSTEWWILERDDNGDGVITLKTFSAPIASHASAATRAGSIPAERRIARRLNLF